MTTVLALSAWKATFGLAIVFFVVFPALLHGLLGFIAAATLGERAENEEFLEAGPDRSQRS